MRNTSIMEEGLKFDTEKLRWDLLPIECVEDIVKILTFGAKKYAPDNWKIVNDAENRYYSALMRHISTWRQGEKIDPESGLNHLSHALCNLIFLLWLDKQNNGTTEIS